MNEKREYMKIDEEKVRENERLYRNRRRETVYISGAITDQPAYQTRFRRAKQRLKSLGYSVFNPTVMPGGLPYESYLKIGKAMIEEVDIVFMLSGWERSEGAKIEYNHAIEHGKVILFEMSREDIDGTTKD